MLIKDVLGSELKVGDMVIICPRNNMNLGIVKTINPKSVKISTINISYYIRESDTMKKYRELVKLDREAASKLSYSKLVIQAREEINWTELEGNLNIGYINEKENVRKLLNHTVYSAYIIKVDNLNRGSLENYMNLGLILK